MANTAMDMNLEVYSNPDIIAEYGGAWLFPAEEAILERIRKYGRPRCLDIGVGAGRTTTFLKNFCSSYIGIDYSSRMIDVARATHPEMDLRVMDARNIANSFAGLDFDLVLFSFNGIDYVDHEGRIKILHSIGQVLAEDGRLMLSSHHLAFGLTHRKFRIPIGLTRRRPIRALVRMAAGLPAISRAYWNYRRYRDFERVDNGFAVLNDRAHAYSLLTYYVDPEHQKQQCHLAGIKGHISVWNPFERCPGIGIDSQVSWLYYLVEPLDRDSRTT